MLSDIGLKELGKEIVERRTLDQFCISVLTHFQILWGYVLANRSSEKYDAFIKKIRLDIIPLTKLDSEKAARMKPSKKDLTDALIAAMVNRNEAYIWTKDSDFLKFLPKDNVRLFR